MQPAGSDAFGQVYCTDIQTIKTNDSVVWQFNDPSMKNADNIPGTPEIYIRKTGIYIIKTSLDTNQAAQFTMFVNNIPVYKSIFGKNAGASQVIGKQLFKLCEGDTVTLRNFDSGISIDLNTMTGGTVAVQNAHMIFHKISPTWEQLECSKYSCELEDVIERNKCLFREVLEKLMCEPCLLLGGSKVYGQFWKTTGQAVNLESPVTFEHHRHVKNVTHTLGDSNIQVLKGGIFILECCLNTGDSSQYVVFVNGVPMPISSAGNL